MNFIFFYFRKIKKKKRVHNHSTHCFGRQWKNQVLNFQEMDDTNAITKIKQSIWGKNMSSIIFYEIIRNGWVGDIIAINLVFLNSNQFPSTEKVEIRLNTVLKTFQLTFNLISQSVNLWLIECQSHRTRIWFSLFRIIWNIVNYPQIIDFDPARIQNPPPPEG